MAITKKVKRVVEAEGIAHVNATFNNTLITITDAHGNTVSWGSSGKAGFKGSKKSTPFAATVAAEQAAREALSAGVRRVHVRVQGPGSGRESAIQALATAGLQVKSIKDVTPIPHNGCRPPESVSCTPPKTSIMEEIMKIGILGSGPVATTLGAGLIKHGHEVTLGTRDAAKLADFVKANPKAKVASFADAAKFGEVIVLSSKALRRRVP